MARSDISIKLRSLFISLALLAGQASLALPPLPHDYYVSLGEFRYNETTGCMDLSLRIFPDDMDRALEETWGSKSQLLTPMEDSRADSMLSLYLAQHLEVLLDGKPLSFKYLGKEAEADAMWCYLESGKVDRPVRRMEIRNSLLTDIFPGQVNICQVYVGSWNKGLLLNRQKPRGSLVLPQ